MYLECTLLYSTSEYSLFTTSYAFEIKQINIDLNCSLDTKNIKNSKYNQILLIYLIS